VSTVVSVHADAPAVAASCTQAGNDCKSDGSGKNSKDAAKDASAANAASPQSEPR